MIIVFKKNILYFNAKLFMLDIDPALTSVIVCPNYMISEYHTQIILE